MKECRQAGRKERRRKEEKKCEYADEGAYLSHLSESARGFGLLAA